MQTIKLTTGLALLLGAVSTTAADWKGQGELGIVLARGNTDSTTANVKMTGSKQDARWKHAFSAAALRATGEDVDTGEPVDTAERYYAMWQTDWALTAHAFTFGNLRYDQDRFSGFDYQASVSTGFGYKFIDTTRTTLSGQLGAGSRQLRNSLTEETSRDFIFRGDINFQRILTDTTTLINKFTAETGGDNNRLTNDFSLQVKMTDSLALGVGVGIQFNSNPPPPLKRTDTLTTLNLVYAINK